MPHTAYFEPLADGQEADVSTGRHTRKHPVLIGTLAGSDSDGRILVRIDGGAPKIARTVAGLDLELLRSKECLGSEVLVLFAEQATDCPIIVDLVHRPLDHLVDKEGKKEQLPAEKDAIQEAYIDGKRVVLEAEREVVLKCGRASITLRRDGKIVLKGDQIISRAHGLQKIKGTSVRIN